VTKPKLVMTRARMLHSTRQCKDTLQRRSMILLSFLFQIYLGICVSIIIRIKKDLTK